MKSGLVLGMALLSASALLAQNQAGFVSTPGLTRGFGSVVFPGGTSAMPGIQRTTGSVLYPAGGGPQIGIPSIPYMNPTVPQGRPQQGRRPGGNAGYAYAVYVPNYYDQQYYAQPAYAPQAAQPITVIYPPAPAPVIINHYGSGEMQQGPATRIFEMPGRKQQVEETTQNEPVHYMLAFQDHSVYAAIAYWVDGDTLHYFTAGNTHNQASLSLVDRDLTDRLNRDTGVVVKLPARK